MRQSVELHCRACGSRIELRPGPAAASAPDGGPQAVARECLACPVCWAVGPALEEARVAEAPVPLDRTDGYRILGCVRPDGPELSGASREEQELARLLWRLAAE